MTIEQTLEHVATLQYPRNVDVVDGVMAQVVQHPYLRLSPPATRRWRMAAVAAAAAAVIVVGAFLLRPSGYSNEDMASAIMQFNDYSSWTTIEEAANPIADIYEEENLDQ